MGEEQERAPQLTHTPTIPAFGVQSQEGQEFKVTLSSRANSRLGWVAGDLVSEFAQRKGNNVL